MNTKIKNQAAVRRRFKYFKNLLKVLIFLLVFVLAAPYALHLDPVLNLIARQISLVDDGRLEINSISWGWLPAPGITLSNVHFTSSMVNVKIDEALANVGMMDLFSGKPSVSVELIRPDITVKTLKTGSKTTKKASSEKNKPIAFSAITIAVKNGHVRLPSDGFFKKFDAHTPPLEILDLDANVSVTPDKVDIHSLSRLTFIQRLNANVSFEKRKATSEEDDKDRTYWNLDISGKTVNLTEAVEKVMLLFGENRTAKMVCGIVRGGRAESGGFRFEGYTEDFKKFPLMKIDAIAQSAVIQVPGVDLHLTDTRGPIKIENAVLTGENLSATLGNSYGKNCSLQLGLAGNDRDFNLAIDLDADLSELPDLLRNNLLKKNQKIVNELGNINNAEGRADAKLIIGDKLKNMAVKVIILNSDNRIDYQRFKFPVAFNKGTLEFFPGKCIWSGVNGSIGPHVIHDTKGSVLWQKRILLDIEKINADIHSGPMLSELTAWPAVADKLQPFVRSMDGQMEITDLKVLWPINNLKDLEYSAKLKCPKIVIDTPFLPGKANISDVTGYIGNRTITLSLGTLSIGNQNLNIKTVLDHDNWGNFTGSLNLRGNIEKNFADWVKKKGWIPPPFFPGIPCRLEPLKISFSSMGTSVSGTLIPLLAKEKKISTRIDLDLKKDKIDLRDLTIITPENKASLWLSIDKTCEPNLNIGFTGNIDKTTLSLILDENRLLYGNISGDFQLTHFFNKTDVDQCKGALKISDCSIQSGDNHINIRHADIKAHESTIDLNQSLIEFNGEKILVDGQVIMSEDGIETGMDIRSDYISVNNMVSIYKSLKEKNRVISTKTQGQTDKCPTASPPLFGLPVTGNIDFDFKKFGYHPDTTPPDTTQSDTTQSDTAQPSSEKKPLIWDDLTGSITLMPESDITISVLAGSMCGINTTGMWTRSSEQFNININKDNKEEIDLEQFFSCIGKDEAYLTGKCALNMNISGSPCHWESGQVEFDSRDGVIGNNINGLSKILTLINVTELFSVNTIRQFFSKGYPYSKIKIIGDISNNRLILKDAFIIGNGINFFSRGSIDLCSKEMNLIVFVKPFKTIDSLVTTIPFVKGKDLGDGKGSIAVIPIKVDGQIRDPDVSYYKGDLLE